jgi:hypothetical protein|tara:strand:- start:127 stop:234 length:108 start_codon:yes stop_codon:yes gene_type:complete
MAMSKDGYLDQCLEQLVALGELGPRQALVLEQVLD